MEYHVRVKPGSSQEKIVTSNSNELTVYLHASPHGGEANASLIRLLAKHLKTPKTSISIIRGAHSRNKVIRVQ